MTEEEKDNAIWKFEPTRTNSIFCTASICTNSLCEFDGLPHIHLRPNIDTPAIIITGLCNWIRRHPLFQERK